MPAPAVTIALPIADRRASHAFYRDAFGLHAFGEPAADGVPEPLQFALADGVSLMLVPTGGFGWVIGGRSVAPSDTSECLLTLAAETREEVDAIVARARKAGASPVAEPASQPWGYAGTVSDLDGHLWMVSTGPDDG